MSSLATRKTGRPPEDGGGGAAGAEGSGEFDDFGSGVSAQLGDDFRLDAHGSFPPSRLQAYQRASGKNVTLDTRPWG